MNDTAEANCNIIRTVILLIFLFLFILALYDYGHVVSEVKPQTTIRGKVLSYPCKDNSPTLQTAEAKVNAKIDRVIQAWNSTCRPNRKDCGAVEKGGER
jgi:hypothetical protein